MRPVGPSFSDVHTPEAVKKPIRELSSLERLAVERHFLGLASEDRRLRFGAGIGDPAIRSYVKGIDFGRDAVFGFVDDDMRIIGAAHLVRCDSYAELGVSVLAGHRGGGIGGALLRRAHMRARNWDVKELFMHCLTENGAMMRLARQQGMDIVSGSGETDAWLALPPADASSRRSEDLEQRVALVDYAFKSRVAGERARPGFRGLLFAGNPPA